MANTPPRPNNYNLCAQALNLIASDSNRRGYNRLLDEQFYAEGTGYALIPILVHEHIAGEPAEVHIRCYVQKDGDTLAFLDVWPAMLLALGGDFARSANALIAGYPALKEARERLWIEAIRTSPGGAA